jgi:hypothetical protein
MRVSSLIVFAGLALPQLGLADQPAVPASQAVAASSTVTASPTATVSPAVAGSPGEGAAVTAADPPAAEKTPEQLKREAAEAKIRKTGAYGYKPETTKSGDIVYCKTEAPIGSRFETKQCRSFEQLRDEALHGKEYLENMQRAVPPNKG